MEVCVKRFIIFLLISLVVTGAVFPQDRSIRQGVDSSQTIEGVLKLERGIVAVQSGDSVYYVPLLNRYIGFINDLKEGTNVSVEGYVFRNIVHPRKLTLNDKSYDFNINVPGFLSELRNNFLTPERRNITPERRGFVPEQRNIVPERRGFVPEHRSFTPDRRNSFPDRRSFTPDRRSFGPNQRNFNPGRGNGNSRNQGRR